MEDLNWRNVILETEENKNAFGQWFWEDEENRRDLIKALNENENRPPDITVRYGDSPLVYGIAVNHPFEFQDHERQWKFCYIGYTQQAKREKQMGFVLRRIKQRYDDNEPEVLFILPIKGSDRERALDMKRNIQMVFGHKISKAKAEELDFPKPKGWVLTTQELIDRFQQKKAQMEQDRQHVTTEVFDDQDVQFSRVDNPVPPGLQNLPMAQPPQGAEVEEAVEELAGMHIND